MNTIRRTSRVLAAAVSASACMMPALPSYGASITISDNSCASFSSSSDGNGSLTITCGGGLQPPPINCTLTASPTTVPATGGVITLTASNCGIVSGYTKNSQATGQTSTSWQDTIGPTQSATDVPFNYVVAGTGSPASASATVIQKGTAAGGPVGGTATSCPGFSNTWPLSLAWGAIGSGNVASLMTKFNGNDIIVASFTTPAVTSAGQIGTIQAAEYSSIAINRTASLSLTPCSFDNNLASSGFGAHKTLVSGNTVSISYVIGGSSKYYPVLQPGTTYFFNIKNSSGIGGGMKVEMIKPPGL